MLFPGYWNIVFCSAAIYIFMIVAIRLFGKKELAQLSVVDLVFILLVSNAVQNAMVGSDNTLSGGLVAAATLFIINYAFKVVLYRFPHFGRLVQGESVMLVYKGRVIEKNMKKARINIDEIHEAIREHGVGTLEQVDLAVLEADGNISVLSDEFRHRTVNKRKAKRSLSREP